MRGSNLIPGLPLHKLNTYIIVTDATCSYAPKTYQPTKYTLVTDPTNLYIDRTRYQLTKYTLITDVTCSYTHKTTYQVTYSLPHQMRLTLNYNLLPLDQWLPNMVLSNLHFRFSPPLPLPFRHYLLFLAVGSGCANHELQGWQIISCKICKPCVAVFANHELQCLQTMKCSVCKP